MLKFYSLALISILSPVLKRFKEQQQQQNNNNIFVFTNMSGEPILPYFDHVLSSFNARYLLPFGSWAPFE